MAQTHLVAWNTGSMHASQPATAKKPKRPRMRSRRKGHLDGASLRKGHRHEARSPLTALTYLL
eukprot:scaffold129327_cov65-Phaeocystis_antarctica.AAC.6